VHGIEDCGLILQFLQAFGLAERLDSRPAVVGSVGSCIEDETGDCGSDGKGGAGGMGNVKAAGASGTEDMGDGRTGAGIEGSGEVGDSEADILFDKVPLLSIIGASGSVTGISNGLASLGSTGLATGFGVLLGITGSSTRYDRTEAGISSA